MKRSDLTPVPFPAGKGCEVSMPEDLEPLREFGRFLLELAITHPISEPLHVVVEVGSTLRIVPEPDERREIDRLFAVTEKLDEFIQETKAMVKA